MTRPGLVLSLSIASAVCLFAACLIGSTTLSPVEVMSALLGFGDAGNRVIVWEIRMPRALAAFVVGVSLGLAGAALQGLLRNPLAEPGVLGVSASASLFATAALFYGLTEIWPYALPISAIIGALAATSLLAIIGARMSSMITLILIGVGISSFATAVMALLMNLAPNPFSLADMVNWMLGSVANRSFDDLALAAPFIAVGSAILVGGKRNLSALTLGEETAEAIGLNVSRARILVVTGAGLVTGAAVSIAGAIGFVGIVAPHLVRPWVCFDPARTLIPSGMLAGIILVSADILVRVLPTSSELKLGVVAALLGAPAFIFIAAQRRDAPS